MPLLLCSQLLWLLTLGPVYPCRAWFPYPPSVEALQAEMAKWSDFSAKARRIASMLIVAEATIQEVRANAMVCIRLGFSGGVQPQGFRPTSLSVTSILCPLARRLPKLPRCVCSTCAG